MLRKVISILEKKVPKHVLKKYKEKKYRKVWIERQLRKMPKRILRLHLKIKEAINFKKFLNKYLEKCAKIEEAINFLERNEYIYLFSDPVCQADVWSVAEMKWQQLPNSFTKYYVANTGYDSNIGQKIGVFFFCHEHYVDE